VSAYVLGLPVHAAADTHAKAERAIRAVLTEYLRAHPDSQPDARVRVARFSDKGLVGGPSKHDEGTRLASQRSAWWPTSQDRGGTITREGVPLACGTEGAGSVCEGWFREAPRRRGVSPRRSAPGLVESGLGVAASDRASLRPARISTATARQPTKAASSCMRLCLWESKLATIYSRDERPPALSMFCRSRV
jgi:hypothetical protein